MQARSVLAGVAAIALVVVSTACGGGAAPAASGSQPAAQSSSGGGGGGGSSPTAAPVSKAAPTAAAKASSSGGTSSVQLEKVGIPKGSKYDPYKPVKIGDVVELPNTGIVLQVTGAKTAEYDAQKDLLLVDLILGNKGKDELIISSVMMMGAVTSDWHAYSLDLDELLQAAFKISAMKVATFDGEVPAGEARKGTAVIPVPKGAQGLGFVFHPMSADLSKSDPAVYVGLGINGDFTFPIIPENVQALKAGTVYKVGQPVKAPKRGVAIQVNGARERTQSVPNFEINVADKVVLVDVTTRLFGDAKPLLGKELSLVDSKGGHSFDGTVGMANVVLMAENAMGYSSPDRRGMLVFKGPRDATGLKLVFSPDGDDKVEFDLGTLAKSTTAPGGAAAPAGPKLAPASVLPDELKSLPMPTGFEVVENSTRRSASRGKFQSADAQLFGKMSIEDLNTFYKTRLAAQWDAIVEDKGSGDLQYTYMNKKDQSLTLYINAEQTDTGTTIDIRIEKD